MFNSFSNSNFPNQTRVRVCGLLVKDDRLLLLKHIGLGPNGFIWSPPGGGVKFEETVKEALNREFIEEVNLEIEVQELTEDSFEGIEPQ